MDAIETLGGQCDGRILALNSYENRVYQVGMEDRGFIIAKFYRPERWSNEQILEEHQFSLQLAEQELPIVAPMADANGETLHQYQQFRFALFERRGGHAPDLDTPMNLEILGRLLARIHNIGHLSAFEHRPSINIDEYVRESAAFLSENHFIPGDLQPAYQSLIDDLLPMLERAFSSTHYESLRLHGDCHPGNLLWRDDQPNFVDFDDCRQGPAIQDLWMLLSGDRDQQQSQLQHLLKGYRQFAPFNGAELQLIEPLRTLRLVHYSGWLARRWDDPAFPMHFPWFNTQRYWSEHILTLREQFAALQEPPLSLPW